MNLRNYQQKAIDLLWRYFANNGGNPLLEAPTGAGKSVIQAGFIKRAIEAYPETRVLALCHVKELVEQNSGAMMRAMPGGDIGVHSAGLGRRDIHNQIIFGGIQSVATRVNDLGRFDLVFVDEAHLVPKKSDGQYRDTLERLRRFNPKLKVIGFTATPYRLDGGLLVEGDDRIFTDLIAAETAGMSIHDLLAAGYLAPLTTAPVATRIEVDGIRMVGGDYHKSLLAKAMAASDATERACSEILHFGQDRKSWLIFATDVAHAERVERALHEGGISARTITGETPSGVRDSIIAQYRRGEIRALVNVNVLTTGFDAPQTDLLAFLRPTKSTGLYVQSCGRGMRIAEGKTDCLVLDFAGNIEEHGPVDNVRPRLKRGQGEGTPPMRECDACGALMHAAYRQCEGCGKVFEIDKTLKLSEKASALNILSTSETFEPTRFRVSIHTKPGSPDSLRVDWYAGLRKVCSEWVCLFHAGYPQQKACEWWFAHVGGDLPASIEEAHQRAGSLTMPESLTVFEGGKFPKITNRAFNKERAA